ncbi:putative ribonuclease H-like domain-containing protein [Tanacetum coccineum]
MIPFCITNPLISHDPKDREVNAREKPTKMDKSGALDKDRKDEQATRSEFERLLQQEQQTKNPNSTNSIKIVGTPVSTDGPSCTDDDPSSLVNAAEASNAFEEHLFEQFSSFKNAFTLPPVSNVTPMDDTGIFGNAYYDEDVEENKSQRLSKLLTCLFSLSKRTQEGDSSFGRSKLGRGNARGASMDVKSAFLYGTIEEEVYVCQPPGFEDPYFPDKVYKEKGDILLVQVYVDDIIFGSTKKSLCDEFEGLMHKRFQMSSMGELTFFLGLQVQQKKDGIFISQDKYVAEILKKFDFATVKTASTPMEPNKALVKDEEADNVDVHLYRSMIGSLMYLTASRPDIMFAVCACARFQVTPKTSHLHAVKRIFRYLKGQPKLGLWYPRDSPFDLEAFSDSDYAGASLDRKSTTGGCQFLGKRLISWQCKKQTIVANSTTEAEYVAAAHCCGQRLIQVIKIHTDHNVADLLTKAFDVSSISNEFGVKTGGCKVNAARHDLVLLGKNLKFVDQHNMVACLEKSKGNDDFHKIVDFLTPSCVHYALTTVIISESSVRSDIYSNDEDGITCLTNDAIFENLALIAPSSTQPRIEEQILVIESSSPQNTQSPRQALQEDTQLPQTSVPIPNVADEASLRSGMTKVVRVDQDLGNTPRSDEERLEQDDLTDFVPPKRYDSPLSRGHTPGSDEDLVIRKLKKKVRKLEKKLRARTLGLNLFKIGTSKIKHLDKENVSKQERKVTRQSQCLMIVTLLTFDMENVKGDVETQGRNTAEQITTVGDTVNTVSIDVSVAGPSNVSTTNPSTSIAGDIFEDEMMTIANTLMAIRSTRPRTTLVVIRDVEEEPRRATLIQRDAKIAQRLLEEEQAQFERDERIAREKTAEQEAKDAALIEQMEDIQARMDTDELLAERLQQEEREQFIIEEKYRMLVEMIAERKRFFAAQRGSRSTIIDLFFKVISEVVKDSRKGKAEGSRKKIVV